LKIAYLFTLPELRVNHVSLKGVEVIFTWGVDGNQNITQFLSTAFSCFIFTRKRVDVAMSNVLDDAGNPSMNHLRVATWCRRCSEWSQIFSNCSGSYLHG